MRVPIRIREIGHGRVGGQTRTVAAAAATGLSLMCCYCDATTDTQIIAHIKTLAVPEDVLQCHHGWAEAARVWSGFGAAGDGEDVAGWIALCQRRARALAQLAVASMAQTGHQPDLRINR